MASDEPSLLDDVLALRTVVQSHDARLDLHIHDIAQLRDGLGIAFWWLIGLSAVAGLSLILAVWALAFAWKLS